MQSRKAWHPRPRAKAENIFCSLQKAFKAYHIHSLCHALDENSKHNRKYTMKYICLLFIFQFTFQSKSLYAQLTADSIKHYLIGTWKLCEFGQSSYYWDAPPFTGDLIEEHDDITYSDSIIAFFANGTFSSNGSSNKRAYFLSKVLNSFESPYKIALGKTEYIFEIRTGGFYLNRLILGYLDENESWSYFFKRPDMCEKGK